MEILLTNNIFFTYLLGVLVILNYDFFGKKQKIAIIYVCSYGLTFNGELRKVIIGALLVAVLFLYEEYLNNDLIKVKYVTKLGHKIKDFLFMYIVQYNILYIILAIGLRSAVCIEYANKICAKEFSETVLWILSLFFVLAGINGIFNKPTEFRIFDQIDQKFKEYPYYFLPQNEEKRKILFEKLEMVADIEDYTFFKRNKSYNCCSLEFLRIVLLKRRGEKSIADTQEKSRLFHEFWQKVTSCFSLESMVWFVKQPYRLRRLKYYLSRGLEYTYELWINVSKQMNKKCKRYLRGYSTIEMQLLRILAYKKGLVMGKPRSLKEAYSVLIRKIFEIIYTTIFFDGQKRYLNMLPEKDDYRYYLLYVYLHTVQTNLNGKVYAPLDKVFGTVDVEDWSFEVLFIITLGVCNLRITQERVGSYDNIIQKYGLDRQLIGQLVSCL